MSRSYSHKPLGVFIAYFEATCTTTGGFVKCGADPVHMKMLVTMMAKVRLQLGRPVHHINRIASLLASPCSGFHSRAGKVVDPLWLLQRELATHRRHDLPPCCKGALLKLTSADLAVRALACPGIQSDGVRLRPLALHTTKSHRVLYQQHYQ